MKLNRLTEIDAATPTSLGPNHHIRSRARLEQILAMPRSQPRPGGSRHRRALYIRVLRWAAIPLIAVMGIILSVGLSGATLPPAAATIANWHHVPTALTSSQSRDADAACNAAIDAMVEERSLLATTLRTPPDMGTGPITSVANGDLVTVAYVGADGTLTTCIVASPEGYSPTVVFAQVRPFDPWDTNRGAFIHPDLADGWGGRQLGTWPYGLDGLEQLARIGFLVLESTQLGLYHDGDPVVANHLTVVHGRIGDDVAALTFITFHDGEVEAALADGWFTTFWPGAAGCVPFDMDYGTYLWGPDASCEPGLDFASGEWPAFAARVTMTDGTQYEVELIGPGRTIEWLGNTYQVDRSIRGNPLCDPRGCRPVR